MRILLAEDDNNIQMIAKLSLEKVGGHQVLCASDGEQTIQLLTEVKPDLILLDVMMPKLNGFETCKKIKENPNLKNIPIIFITARAQAHEVQHGMSIGAVGYILKPFDPMTLHMKIEEILKSHELAA